MPQLGDPESGLGKFDQLVFDKFPKRGQLFLKIFLKRNRYTNRFNQVEVKCNLRKNTR